MKAFWSRLMVILWMITRLKPSIQVPSKLTNHKIIIFTNSLLSAGKSTIFSAAHIGSQGNYCSTFLRKTTEITIMAVLCCHLFLTLAPIVLLLGLGIATLEGLVNKPYRPFVHPNIFLNFSKEFHLFEKHRILHSLSLQFLSTFAVLNQLDSM